MALCVFDKEMVGDADLHRTGMSGGGGVIFTLASLLGGWSPWPARFLRCQNILKYRK